MTIDPRIIEQFNKKAPFPFEEAHVLVLATMGSHAHGVHIPIPGKTRDVDYMCVLVPPSSFVIGSKVWQQQAVQIQYEELDVMVYTWHHFIQMASRNNPNVLPLLWLRPELYITESPLWNEVVKMRHIFSSRLVFHSFLGFAESQSRKMEFFDARKMGEKRRKLVEQFGYDTHNACHTIRILRMCCEFLETGRLNVQREVDAQELCDVKSGKWSVDEVKREHQKLLHRAKLSAPYSSVPEFPDYDRINELTEQTYLSCYLHRTYDQRTSTTAF